MTVTEYKYSTVRKACHSDLRIGYIYQQKTDVAVCAEVVVPRKKNGRRRCFEANAIGLDAPEHRVREQDVHGLDAGGLWI